MGKAKRLCLCIVDVNKVINIKSFATETQKCLLRVLSRFTVHLSLYNTKMAHVVTEGAVSVSTEFGFSRQMLLKYSITKLNKNLTSGIRANACREGRTCGHDAANLRSSRLHTDAPKSTSCHS
jgi:hypothetical protein